MAALAATGAFAQSSVTLFGVVDLAYGVHETTGPSAASIKSRGVMDGGQAGSRIGFRGTEDLGGGLRAEFMVEQGINPSNDELFGQRSAASGHQIDGFSSAGGAAALGGSAGAYSLGSNRQSYLGVSGGFGTVRIGYQYTNLYELSTLAGYHVGSEGVQGGDKAHTHGQAVAGGTRANGITYISPTFNGIQVRLQMGAGSAGREEFTGSSALTATGLTVDKANRTSIMVKYDQGPISAAAAYTQNKITQSARASGYSVLNAYGAGTATTTAITNTAARSAKLLQLGGSYNFGVARVTAHWTDGDTGGSGTTTDNSTLKAQQIGVIVPVGALALAFNYGKATTTLDSNGRKSEDYKMHQIGARYTLSKRTTAYLYTGTTKDNGVVTSSGAAKTYNKDSKTVVGIAHSF